MTMQEVIEKTCYEDYQKDLFNAVIEQIGDWNEVWDCPLNYRDASGGVSGFIYYTDTEKFACDNMADILLCLNEFEQEIGEPLKKDDGNILNWYAWFALEHIIDKVMQVKEN